MLLTVHIGNTKTSVGGFNGNKTVFTGGFQTERRDTDLEFAINVNRILNSHGIKAEEISGTVLSCVVPPLIPVGKHALIRLFKKEPVNVSEESVKSLNIKLDRKNLLGTNLIADAAAVIHDYGAPAVIIDMGTATSIGLIDENRSYPGGMLLPGLQTALNAFFNGVSLIRPTEFSASPVLIGKNTADSITSGAVFGNSEAIDACIDRILEASGIPEDKVNIVATGHLSLLLKPYLRHNVTVDEALTLKGLCYIYNREV